MSAVASGQLWRVQVYGSGTHIVTDDSGVYLYVVVVSPIDMDDDRLRYSICEDLARFLNGGRRPAWLKDLARPFGNCLIGDDGTNIQATGPLYDADPPNLIWQERNDAKSRNARSKLIGRLVHS